MKPKHNKTNNKESYSHQHDYHPAKFGIQRAAFRGCCMSRDEFFRLCREQMVDEPAPDNES